MPSLEVIREIVHLLKTILFPGYFGTPVLSESHHYHIAASIDSVLQRMVGQIYSDVSRREAPAPSFNGGNAAVRSCCVTAAGRWPSGAGAVRASFHDPCRVRPFSICEPPPELFSALEPPPAPPPEPESPDVPPLSVVTDPGGELPANSSPHPR